MPAEVLRWLFDIYVVQWSFFMLLDIKAIVVDVSKEKTKIVTLYCTLLMLENHHWNLDLMLYTCISLLFSLIEFLKFIWLHYQIFCGVHFLLAVLHLNPSPYRKVTVCKTNKREDKGETILHYAPLTYLPPLLFLFLYPLLPLFAALLTTVTAALITPLWSPRVAGTCHLLPRGAWVITSIHPKAGAPVLRSPWR